MADEKTKLETEFEEPVYIMAPHPEAVVVSNEKAVTPGKADVAEETLADLIAAEIQNQVGGLRSELLLELETQTRRIQSDLQAELLPELKGGSELNAKG